MLKVSTGREPIWIDVAEGVRVQFKPWATQAKSAGITAGATVLAAGHTRDVAEVAFTIAAARWGALAWEGIGDQDGELLPLTPDNLQELLEQSEAAYQAVDAGYVIPGLQRSAEKNGSAPSPLGTSPASKPKKARARARRSGAGTTAAPARKSAKPALTS
ncbi:MAG: hypothetical protein JWO72_3122 [Caulobacteraceae bacterium]|nr:hypothetical protein [Caulobacteraceae bacterium]